MKFTIFASDYFYYYYYYYFYYAAGGYSNLLFRYPLLGLTASGSYSIIGKKSGLLGGGLPLSAGGTS